MLKDAGIAGGPRDSRILMAAAVGIDVSRLSLHEYDRLDDIAETRFFASIMDRAANVPVSKLIGKRAFFGREFTVTKDVLDPRPDTETLVEEALRSDFTKVLDLGTGSGAIIVTLLAERQTAAGVATDVSDAALRVAEQNASKLGVLNRLSLQRCNWFNAVGGQFDLIVSNPPYIAFEEMDNLQPEVRLHDPRIALTDEADGLTAYREITKSAPMHLNLGGRLLFEIGPTQGATVSDMMRAVGFHNVRVLPDLDSRDRVVAGEMPKNSGSDQH